MATTSPDNVWSPDAPNPYNLTVDLAAMATSVQAALTAVRSGAAAAVPAAATQGNVNSGTGTNAFVAPQTLRAATWLPWSVAAGLMSNTSPVNNGSGRTLTVSLPTGRFSQAPLIFVENAGSSRLTTAVVNRTSTNFQVRQDNLSGGTASGETGFMWVALQMTSGAAAG